MGKAEGSEKTQTLLNPGRMPGEQGFFCFYLI